MRDSTFLSLFGMCTLVLTPSAPVCVLLDLKLTDFPRCRNMIEIVPKQAQTRKKKQMEMSEGKTLISPYLHLLPKFIFPQPLKLCSMAEAPLKVSPDLIQTNTEIQAHPLLRLTPSVSHTDFCSASVVRVKLRCGIRPAQATSSLATSVSSQQ